MVILNSLVFVTFCLFWFGAYFYIHLKEDESPKEDLILIKKGCCQYIMSKKTGDFQHHSGCENPIHY